MTKTKMTKTTDQSAAVMALELTLIPFTKYKMFAYVSTQPPPRVLSFAQNYCPFRPSSFIPDSFGFFSQREEEEVITMITVP